MAAGIIFHKIAFSQPGPSLPGDIINEKQPLLAGLCWKFAATNNPYKLKQVLRIMFLVIIHFFLYNM